jgi:hypothetical protein
MEGEVIRIEVPYEFAFNQTVQYYKGVLAEKIMRLIHVEEVDYVELHKKPHPLEEVRSDKTNEQEKSVETAEASKTEVSDNLSK